MDDYSSKGSTVHPVKKYNRMLGAYYMDGGADEDDSNANANNNMAIVPG